MTNTYVPPHIRRGSQPSSTPATPMFSIYEIRNQFNSDGTSTLNASISAPERLSYVALFRGQHKDWPGKLQILCKSNLDLLSNHSTTTPLLPQVTIPHDNSVSSTALYYPIFVQSDITKRFAFSGYYTIRNITYLEPYSEGLITRLQAKFRELDGTDKGRSPGAWQESLGMRWAVVEFELVSKEVTKEMRLENPMTVTHVSVKEALEASRLRSKGSTQK